MSENKQIKTEEVKIFESIRIIAILKGRDLKSLMEEAGVERQTYYNSEKKGSIETEKLSKIAKALNVNAPYLFQDVKGMLLDFIEKTNSASSELQLPQQ